MRATAPTSSKKANLVFELYIDSEAKKAAVKKALKVKKMAGRLKSFTTTGSTMQVKVPTMRTDMRFLSNTYVNSNPLEPAIEQSNKDY